MKRRHECITHKARKTIIAKTGRSDEDKDQDEDEDADDDDDDDNDDDDHDDDDDDDDHDDDNNTADMFSLGAGTCDMNGLSPTGASEEA